MKPPRSPEVVGRLKDSLELVRASGLPDGALVEVGTDLRLADLEPLDALARAVETR